MIDFNTIQIHATSLNREEVKHLLRRTQFGATKKEIDAQVGKTAEEIVSQITKPTVESKQFPIEAYTNLSNTEDSFKVTNQLAAWWINQMNQSSLNMTERMVHFYHHYFTTKPDQINVASVYYQNTLFRKHALGNFKSLCKEMCLDHIFVSVMGEFNDKGEPNNSFGQHPSERKTISKRQAGVDEQLYFEEEEIKEVSQVFYNRESLAQDFARKLYCYFVYPEITHEVETEMIEPLAETVLQFNFQVQPVLTKLLTSAHFFNSDDSDASIDSKGAFMKSPLDLLVGSYKFLGINLSTQLGKKNSIAQLPYAKDIISHLALIGMDVYEHPEAVGFPVYRRSPGQSQEVITATNIRHRYALADQLIAGYKDEEGNVKMKFDVVDFVENSGNIKDPSNPDEIVSLFLDYMFPTGVSFEKKNHFRDVVLLDNLSADHWKKEWEIYQKTKDDQGIRIQLETLVKHVVQSPEYQLY